MKKIILLVLLHLVLLSFSFATTFEELRDEQQATVLADQETLRITAIGDIMFHMPQVDSAYNPQTNTYAFEEWFKYLSPWFHTRDFVIGNLETTLSKTGPYRGYPGFKSPYEVAQDLKDVGFNVLTTANNHSYDTGFAGLQTTIEALDEAQIAHTGTFSNASELPYIRLEKKGYTVALFAYTYSTNGIKVAADKQFAVQMLSKDQIEKDLATRPTDVDFTIVSLHFGTEYQRAPNQEQIKLVEWLKTKQVDIVLGSHPHVLQKDALAAERDFYVIYSMGNFISNQRDRYKDSGVIVNLDLKKKGNLKTITVNLIPTWVDKDTKYHIMPLNNRFLATIKHINSDDLKRIEQVLSDFKETYKTKE